VLMGILNLSVNLASFPGLPLWVSAPSTCAWEFHQWPVKHSKDNRLLTW
jgi:hypothetical protein